MKIRLTGLNLLFCFFFLGVETISTLIIELTNGIDQINTKKTKVKVNKENGK